ncbi:MAG TPA: BrnA antitoxin family protein [Beijerinckiaceae bacterium]|jgi:uncharacterized protein (DUF4415 family)|nr:BrnA antitoxin family protein [Beijerinckiaceae bacterium]
MANVKDEDIDFSDIPELGDEFWNNAVIEVPEQLRSVTLRVRESVVDEFKAENDDFESRMNAVLESYCARKTITTARLICSKLARTQQPHRLVALEQI